MAPVQVKVVAPAAMSVAEIVTVKVLSAKAAEAGAAVPVGKVNAQTGVLGHEKPVKVVKTFPEDFKT